MFANAVIALGEVLDTSTGGFWFWVILLGLIGVWTTGSTLQTRFPREASPREKVRFVVVAALFLAVAVTSVILMFVVGQSSGGQVTQPAAALGVICFVGLVAASAAWYRRGASVKRTDAK